jgi:hypothetical protein
MRGSDEWRDEIIVTINSMGIFGPRGFFQRGTKNCRPRELNPLYNCLSTDRYGKQTTGSPSEVAVSAQEWRSHDSHLCEPHLGGV